jgi:hypothetical protein
LYVIKQFTIGSGLERERIGRATYQRINCQQLK